MIEPLHVLLGLSAALLGLLLGYGGARILDRFRLNSAQARVAELADQASQKADNILKEAELRTKDELFRKREEFNRELEQGRAELRDQERRLDKRDDNLEQKHQVLLKKERALEHSQRKLNERRPDWGVILVDLRQHGRSEAGQTPHTVGACAEDLHAIIGELGVIDALAGHSFGGKVVATRSTGGVEYLITDERGSVELAAPSLGVPGGPVRMTPTANSGPRTVRGSRPTGVMSARSRTTRRACRI